MFPFISSVIVEFFQFTNFVDFVGLVPHEPELVHLADGEVVVRRTYPCFGFDLKCGKNTDFNYGPWADRQRYSYFISYVSYVYKYNHHW